MRALNGNRGGAASSIACWRSRAMANGWCSNVSTRRATATPRSTKPRSSARCGQDAPGLEIGRDEQNEKVARIEKVVNDLQSSFNGREKLMLDELKSKAKIPDKKSPDYTKLLATHPGYKELQKLQTALDAEKKNLT